MNLYRLTFKLSNNFQIIYENADVLASSLKDAIIKYHMNVLPDGYKIIGVNERS